MHELLIGLTEEMSRRGILYAEAIREFRRTFLTTALRDNEGNLCRTANHLRMHRNTLTRQIADLQINVHAIRSGARRRSDLTAERRKVA